MSAEPWTYQSRQKQAHTLVEDLGLPRPLTAESLLHHMETLRETRIVVQDATARMLEAGVCGLWIAVDGESFERIHLAPTTSAVHRQQFINHEFGHMILGHEKERISPERIKRLAPLIPLDAIAYALARSGFTDQQEALAEAIGDRLALIMLEDSRVATHGIRTGFGRVL